MRLNPTFGTKHIILMLASLALITALFILSKRIKFEKLAKILLYVGITSETIKIFYYTIQNEDKFGGILPKTDLPFHLCSIQILLVVIINLSKNEKLNRFILSFMFPTCLVGGAAALILPAYSALEGLPIITAQYFLYHIALIIFALHICTHKDIRLNIGDYVNCLKFLLVMMFFAFYINSLVYDGVSNINFMYVASPPESNLPFLNEDHGWLVYIVHYAFLVIVGVTACYAKPIYTAIRKSRLASKKLGEAAEEKATETV